MGVKVYTMLSTPFRIAGPPYTPTCTELEEYERIELGGGYFGILFHNEHSNIWHIAEETCGALVGGNKSKAAVKKQVMNDIKKADPKVMEEQVKGGLKQMKQADFIEREEWFSRFRKEK